MGGANGMAKFTLTTFTLCIANARLLAQMATIATAYLMVLRNATNGLQQLNKAFDHESHRKYDQ